MLTPPLPPEGASSDYELPGPESPWAPFHKTHMYPIPNQVFDHYNAGELQTLMGLFAGINHAWVAIDNSLFLWDYTHPDPELIGFEDQPHTIHAVALVPPKPGIFVDTITHILAVATASDMVLLGVAAADTPAGTKSVTLYQTKMSLPLRGADVRVIAGAADGRIFFGGSGDVDINELYYQSEEKWFSNRCGRINHSNPGWSSVVSLQSAFWSHRAPEHLVDMVIDDSRKLVYTLSSRSTIRTYHMEAPDRLSKVIEKEKVHCLRDIAHMINQSKLLSDRTSIVSISPISKQEASKLHLMALTDTGCRLFFSATSASSYLYGPQANAAPQSMQLQFIKFPPSQGPRRPSQLVPLGPPGSELVVDLDSTMLLGSRRGARFAPGYFLDFVSSGDDANADALFVAAPESGRLRRASPTAPLRFFEQGGWIDLGSRAEAVGLVSRPFAAASQPLGFGNELAVQFDEPPSEFAVLTNTGVHVIRRRRLVDAFAAAIRDAPGDEALDPIARRLIQLYGRVETVSAALAVACGHGGGGGGDARPGAARAADQATEDRARGLFVDFGGQPTMAETDGTAPTAEQVRLSSRHDALALYLSRLVRKLWKAPVVLAGVSPAGGVVIDSAVPLAKLAATQEKLERLRGFVEANHGLIQGMAGPSDLQRVASRQEEVALQAEHQALHALQRLMESISEGISFVLMMFDERATDIFARLDEGAQQQLWELRYEKLFSQADGKELAKVLVKAIVNRNIESGSNVETVADALRRRCGSFCSPDDVVIFKAQEQLKRASEQPADGNAERGLLHESLKLLEWVAGSLTAATLQAAVAQYVDLQYYAGAVQLCLVVARERDRGKAALAWVKDGRPANDGRAEAFAERRRCYDLIHEALRHLDARSSREPEAVDGRPTLLATKRLEAYEVVQGSDDEVFHLDLCEWYMRQGWTDRILAMDSPHVVGFLQRLAGSSAEHADLLCRFYTNRGRFFDAAEVQAELALSDLGLGIKDRIRLLSLAKANASVATAGVGRQQQMLNHVVGESLEVANIQDDLLGRLMADERIDADKKADIEQALNGRILELSEVRCAGLPPDAFFLSLLAPPHPPPSPTSTKDARARRTKTAHDRPRAALQPVRRQRRLLRPVPGHLPHGKLPQPDDDRGDVAQPDPADARRGDVEARGGGGGGAGDAGAADAVRGGDEQDPEHRAPHVARQLRVPDPDAAAGAVPVRGGVPAGREHRGGPNMAGAAVPGAGGVARHGGAGARGHAGHAGLRARRGGADARRRDGGARGGRVGGRGAAARRRGQGRRRRGGGGGHGPVGGRAAGAVRGGGGGADVADVRRAVRALRREVAGLMERAAAGSLLFA